jgi:hypothetical protein
MFNTDTGKQNMAYPHVTTNKDLIALLVFRLKPRGPGINAGKSSPGLPEADGAGNWAIANIL